MIRGGCLRETTFVLFALAGLLCLTANAFAATATADANATIIAPLAISASSDLEFGTVAFGVGAGTAVIAANGTRSVTGSGLAIGGSTAAAAFAITGEGNNTYAITLPNSITIDDGNSNTMTVDTFTSSPDTTGTLSGGADTLAVGATLHSAGNQIAGSYTASFNVSVAYN